MSVPYLSDLEGRPAVRFPDGNKIQFWMDFACWEGIPSDRDFYINGESAPQHASFYLVARGYGVRGDYGNGSIMVNKSALLMSPADRGTPNA
jgi:hypothetical protein